MSVPIVPRALSLSEQAAQRAAARAAGHLYIDRLGWAVFLERRGSDGVIRSLRMCDACRSTPHSRETCPHPACHGFYAATTDHEAFDRLWSEHTEGDVLAVRTGQASGIFVVDFDLKHDGPAAHDAWGEATGLSWTFPSTLRQRTKSGGFHLVYRLPPATLIKSRNAVTLRGVDVKAEGGLFVVDPTPGYEWMERVHPADAGSDVLCWAADAPVHRRAAKQPRLSKLMERTRRPLDRTFGGMSGTIAQFSTLGNVPSGDRDTYVNAVVWLLRKQGHEWDVAVEILRDEWEHLEHPEGDEFRWEWCMYKLERVWRDVQPDPVVAAGTRWVANACRTIIPHPGRRS